MITRRQIVMGAAASMAAAPFANGATSPVQADCRRTTGGMVQLTWPGAEANVLVADQPEGPFNRTLARAASSGWMGTIPVSPRPYFRLARAGGRPIEVAERVLPLQGGRNFRDLGGYYTVDGRMVRWGQLFRSGSMVGLTDADYDYLHALGVRMICDFRTTSERRQEPTRWQGPQMYSRDYEMDTSALMRSIGSGQANAASVRKDMTAFYETAAYDQAEAYRVMFKELVAGHAPLTFHCSAGKDRTGVAAALILTALGVPRATVVADYALTEKVTNFDAMMSQAAKGGAVPAGMEGIMRLPADIRAPLMRSDPAYIEACLTGLEKREGSVLAFLDKRLGVSTADVKTLKDRYLKRV